MRSSPASARRLHAIGLAALVALVPSAALHAADQQRAGVITVVDTSLPPDTTDPTTSTDPPTTTEAPESTESPESTEPTVSSTSASSTAPTESTVSPSSSEPAPDSTIAENPQGRPAAPAATTTTTEPPLLATALVAAAAVGLPAPTCSVFVTVRLGTRGLPATCVETRLVQYGYWLQGPNDNFDATAVNALQIFQGRNGLVADGVAGKATLQALGIWRDPPVRPAPTCTVSLTVRLGTRGLPATCVETRLVQYGYWLQGPNDNFDSTAVNALRVFQARSGLAADGVAGKATLQALGIWAEPRPMPPALCSTPYPVYGGDTGFPGRCVETRLVQLGYWLRGPDDSFDSSAVTALQGFQSRQGLAATGVADFQTLLRLGIWRSAGFPTPAGCRVHGPIRLGSTGATAKCVEARLVQLGYWLAGPNQTFDATAVRALKNFQYKVGLATDGIGGARTLQRLGIYDPNPPPPPPPGQLPANSGSGRRIVYSRAQQRIWAVDSSGVVVKTHRVSGRTYEPYRGTYRVFSRSLNTYSAADPSVRWRYMVRFTKGPDGGNIGFHEIPNRYGRPLQTKEQLGLPLSGGCVRQATSDAQWVWNWAGIGTVVVVL